MRKELIVLDFELAARARLECAVGFLINPLAERLVVILVVDDLKGIAGWSAVVCAGVQRGDPPP